MLITLSFDTFLTLISESRVINHRQSLNKTKVISFKIRAVERGPKSILKNIDISVLLASVAVHLCVF